MHILADSSSVSVPFPFIAASFYIMAAAQTNFGVSKCLTEVKIVNPCNRLELSQTRPLQTLTSRCSQRKHFATMRVHQPSNIFAGPVASIPDYGLLNYGISRVPSPTQPSESSENGESPLVTQFWDYGTPRPYNTPSRFVMVLCSLCSASSSPILCSTESHRLVYLLICIHIQSDILADCSVAYNILVACFLRISYQVIRVFTPFQIASERRPMIEFACPTFT